MGNQSGGSNSKQRQPAQPDYQNMMQGANQGTAWRNNGREWEQGGGGGSKGGGSKGRDMDGPDPRAMGSMAGNMLNGRRKPMEEGGMQADPGQSPSGAGMSNPSGGWGAGTPNKFSDEQKAMLNEAGMGRENWDDNSYQTDGGPTGSALLAKMKSFKDPADQYRFFVDNVGMGRGGNDLQSQLLLDKGGRTQMNDWINSNELYHGATAGGGPSEYTGGGKWNGAAPTPMGATTDTATAMPKQRRPMTQQRGMRRAQGSGNIQQLLARLMGGGY